MTDEEIYNICLAVAKQLKCYDRRYTEDAIHDAWIACKIAGKDYETVARKAFKLSVSKQKYVHQRQSQWHEIYNNQLPYDHAIVPIRLCVQTLATELNVGHDVISGLIKIGKLPSPNRDGVYSSTEYHRALAAYKEFRGTKQYYFIEDIKAATGISRNTITKWIKEGSVVSPNTTIKKVASYKRVGSTAKTCYDKAGFDAAVRSVKERAAKPYIRPNTISVNFLAVQTGVPKTTLLRLIVNGQVPKPEDPHSFIAAMERVRSIRGGLTIEVF